jgi:thiamine-monophosphate kinase
MTGQENAPTAGSAGEEAVVKMLIAMLPVGEGVIAGPGDDCAVIDTGAKKWQLLKTDSLIEGVHFFSGTDAVLVGRKAMNRAISDIAAMGGVPLHALVTLVVDSARDLQEISGWYAGMIAAAEAVGCRIVGGETSRLPQPGAVLSISMTGSVLPEHCVFRHGAETGDIVAVTGRLGGSFESGRHLTFSPRLAESRWLVENAKPTAMMDLSDGLGSDLPRLATASGRGYRVESGTIPCHVGVSVEHAISEGEDYELLMTFSPEVFRLVEERWRDVFPGTELTAIGEITESTEVPLSRGWEHYRDE